MNAINLKTFARRMWFENMRIECALRRFQCIEVHTNKSSGNLTESERNRIFFFLNDATNDWIDVVIVHPPIYDAISLRLCTLAYIRSKWSKYSPFMYKLLFFPIQFDLHAPNSRIIQIFPQTVVYLKPDAGGRGGGGGWKISSGFHMLEHLIYLLQSRFGRIQCTVIFTINFITNLISFDSAAMTHKNWTFLVYRFSVFIL